MKQMSEELVFGAIYMAGCKSKRKGDWVTISEIERELKRMGVRIGFTDKFWSRLTNLLSDLRVAGRIEEQITGNKSPIRMIDIFRQQLFRRSVSKNRLDRMAAYILIDGGFSEESKGNVIRLFRDYGFSENESRDRLNEIIEIYSKMEFFI